MPTRRPALLAAFDRVRIVNLPARRDRRRAVTRELARLGLQVDGERVAFHEATRPADAAGFETVGAHGCFQSHLAVLREARDAGVERLLLLEDDVAFSRVEAARLASVTEWLAQGDWDVFYGGSPVPGREGEPIVALTPDQPALLAHFIGFSGRAVRGLTPYLEAMLERPAGSPDGGPMHVDGAYSWYRRAHPELAGYAAVPRLAHQRASRTDIHQLGGLDRIGWLSPAMRVVRSVKSGLLPRD